MMPGEIVTRGTDAIARPERLDVGRGPADAGRGGPPQAALLRTQRALERGDVLGAAGRGRPRRAGAHRPRRATPAARGANDDHPAARVAARTIRAPGDVAGGTLRPDRTRVRSGVSGDRPSPDCLIASDDGTGRQSY